MNNQYIIKYLRKHRFFYIYEHEQEDPTEEQKKQIWNLFYYENVFTPMEYNRYIRGAINYEEMMQRYQSRENDDYYNYIDYLYGEGYFGGGYWFPEYESAFRYWYDQWERVYWRYQEGIYTRENYLKYVKGYVLWIVNNNIGWTLNDEGGYIEDPPESWIPLENPPDLTLPDLGYVGQALEVQYIEGNYYYIAPNTPPDPPFTPQF